MIDFLANFVYLLPSDPLQPYIFGLSDFDGLKWLAWFFPTADAFAVITAWASALAVYVGYKNVWGVVLR